MLWERSLKTFGRTKPSESFPKKKLNSEINKSKLGEIYPGAVKGGLGGLRGSKSRPTGSQGIKGWAYRVPGQRVGLLGPRGVFFA